MEREKAYKQYQEYIDRIRNSTSLDIYARVAITQADVLAEKYGFPTQDLDIAIKSAIFNYYIEKISRGEFFYVHNASRLVRDYDFDKRKLENALRKGYWFVFLHKIEIIENGEMDINQVSDAFRIAKEYGFDEEMVYRAIKRGSGFYSAINSMTEAIRRESPREEIERYKNEALYIGETYCIPRTRDEVYDVLEKAYRDKFSTYLSYIESEKNPIKYEIKALRLAKENRLLNRYEILKALNNIGPISRFIGRIIYMMY